MTYKSINTCNPELDWVLHELVSNVSHILKKYLIGVYLQGSLAIGDFDENSDVDFVIVIDEELTESPIKDLQLMHERIYGLETKWAKCLEGSYFPRAILRDYKKSGSELWYLDNGSSKLERSSHCNSVIVRWILREKGIALSGPKPSTLIGEISVNVLRQAILKSINESGRKILANPEQYNNRFYQSFIVLQYCRKLRDLYTGEVGSKRVGAEWTKRNLDKSWIELIDRAWSGRINPAVSVRQKADKDDFYSTLEFVREIIKRANTFAAEKRIF